MPLDNNGRHIGLESIASKVKVHLCVCNAADTSVDVIWIDYDGKEQKYTTLQRVGSAEMIDTFETHPWIFREKNSREILMVRDFNLTGPVTIYMPKGSVTDECPKRFPIFICTFPSLKHLCHSVLKRWRIPPSELKNSDLPSSVISDYEVFFDRKNPYSNFAYAFASALGP